MTAEQIRREFDWSHTKTDMVDRVIRAVEAHFDTLVACCGPVKPNTVIAWCYLDKEFPLSPNNLVFRSGLSDVESDESVLAVRIGG